MDPLYASTTELAAALRAGRLTARQALDAHLGRIVAVDGALNAVVAPRFEQARAEADAADEALAAGRPGALLGVPITVKEFFAVEGCPHTAGLPDRRAVRAAADATAVARLRAAGAVIMGLTNGPEGGLWSETTNPIYGRTNNPWDPRRTPGGSSGGEAAIIAAGGSPLGLGSDIGGSIRIPASFCGVAGHKPTGGLVPTTGHHPHHPSTYLCAGPLARTVADLHLAMQVLAGPAHRIDRPDCLPPEALIVLIPKRALRRAHPEVQAAILRIAEGLHAQGASVHDWPLPDLDRAFWIWAATLSTAGGPTYAELLLGDAQSSIWPEVARALFGASTHSAPPLLVAAAEAVTGPLPLLDHDALIGRRDRLTESLAGVLDPRTVLLLPTMPRPAPRHGGMFLRFADAGWCGLFNVLDLPATTVPVGFTKKRLPIGAQVVAGHGLDHIALAAAAQIEALSGGWVRAEP